MFSLAEFTSRDGIAESDRAQYNQLTASFEADLRPTGALEVCLAAEILRATWRVQWYAAIDGTTLSDDAARAALSRARASAAMSLRWGMSELRNLQTNREIQRKLGIHLPGIADIRQILKFTGKQPTANPTERTQSEDLASAETKTAGVEDTKITERTQLVPRGAACPCGSGEKYKRCCGTDAPPVPGDWLKRLKDAA